MANIFRNNYNSSPNSNVRCVNTRVFLSGGILVTFFIGVAPPVRGSLPSEFLLMRDSHTPLISEARWQRGGGVGAESEGAGLWGVRGHATIYSFTLLTELKN